MISPKNIIYTYILIYIYFYIYLFLARTMNLKTKVSFILEQAFIQAREDGTTKTGETKIYDK